MNPQGKIFIYSFFVFLPGLLFSPYLFGSTAETFTKEALKTSTLFLPEKNNIAFTKSNSNPYHPYPAPKLPPPIKLPNSFFKPPKQPILKLTNPFFFKPSKQPIPKPTIIPLSPPVKDFNAPIETGRFELEPKLKYFVNSLNFNQAYIFQGELAMAFQWPVFTADGRFKILTSGGLGYHLSFIPKCKTIEPKTTLIAPTKPKPLEPPFDGPIFQENYDRRLQEYYKDLKQYKQDKEPQVDCSSKNRGLGNHFPYLIAEVGVLYDFGPVALSLRGGGLVDIYHLSHGQTIGITNALGLKGDFTDSLGWSMDIVSIYYVMGRDSYDYKAFYWGVSLSLSILLQKWTESIASVF